MIELVIFDIIDKYNYVFKDNKNNEYKLNIEFVNLKFNKGDLIYIDKKVLEEHNIYTYGKVNNPKLDLSDYIKVVTKDMEYILERYYG